MKPGSFADQFDQLTREWAEADRARILDKCADAFERRNERVGAKLCA